MDMETRKRLAALEQVRSVSTSSRDRVRKRERQRRGVADGAGASCMGGGHVSSGVGLNVVIGMNGRWGALAKVCSVTKAAEVE